MKTPNTLKALLGAGLLLGTSLALQADDTVTFQVDLSRYTNSAGGQAATLVDVRGQINGWAAGWNLINNGANVYTNTFTVTGTTGDQLQYKFTYTTCAGTSWEDDNPPPGAGQPPDAGNNRILQLVGAPQVLPVVPLYQPSVSVPINYSSGNITFQVDMTEQIALGNFVPGSGVDKVTISGAITSWGDGVQLTNNPSLPGNASNIYSTVLTGCGVAGTRFGEYKFRMNGGWEDLANNEPDYTGGNRNFIYAGGDQVLPVVYYKDQPVGVLTNYNVTFLVDMTPMVLSGGFTNGVSSVTVSGSFGNWGTGTPLENDPNATGPSPTGGYASNVYSATVPVSDTMGNWVRYKFRADGGWESAAVYGVGNNLDRLFFTEGTNVVLPVVTYNDASLCDLLAQDVAVTITLHIVNGALDVNSIPFDKANDIIYVNGDYINWNNTAGYWNATLPQMTNNPVGSDYYQQTVVVPRGKTRGVQFKFGISGTGHGGLDNEAASGANHQNWIRTSGSTYSFPTAEFGRLATSTLVESQWGNLAVGQLTNGKVPITWLGLPCITLQTKSSVSSGSWTDLPATDGNSATNWTPTGSEQFFRLLKRPNP